MAKRGPKISPDRVARILVDASEAGDDGAAAKHNVSRRTIENYRAKYSTDPIVAELYAKLKEGVVEDWLQSAKQTRSRLLAKVETLALQSDDLRQVAGALKIVHDAVLAEQLLTDGGQPQPSARVGSAAHPHGPLSSWTQRQTVAH